MRPRIVEDGCRRRLQRRFKDDAGKIGMGCGGFEGEICAKVATGEDNGRERNMACAGEVLKGRFCIFAPAPFAGVFEMALAVAAVIKRENVETGVMERCERRDGFAEVASLPVEIEGG